MGKYIFKYKNDYYLKDYDYRLSFKLVNDKWEQIDFDIVSPFSNPWKEMNDDLAKQELGDLYPNDDLAKITDENNRREYLEKIKKLSLTTPRKVVGWVFDSNIHVLKECDDSDDTYYAAVYKYFKENKYLLTGEDYQNMDAEILFDDYTYMSFSRRGFGFLMALLHEQVGRYSYSSFMESMFIPDKDKKIPPYGLIKGYSLNNRIFLKNDEYELLKNKMNDCLKNLQNTGIMLVIEDLSRFYYPSDSFIIHDESGHENAYNLDELLLIHNKEELIEHIKEIEEDDYISYVSSFDKNKEFKYPLLFILLSN